MSLGTDTEKDFLETVWVDRKYLEFDDNQFSVGTVWYKGIFFDGKDYKYNAAYCDFPVHNLFIPACICYTFLEEKNPYQLVLPKIFKNSSNKIHKTEEKEIKNNLDIQNQGSL